METKRRDRHAYQWMVGVLLLGYSGQCLVADEPSAELSLKELYDQLPMAPQEQESGSPASGAAEQPGSAAAVESTWIAPYLPFVEQEPASVAFKIYNDTSLTHARSYLVADLVEAGFEVERAEAVDRLVIEVEAVKEKAILQTRELQTGGFLRTEQQKLEIIRIHQRRNAELDAELTRKLFEMLTEVEECKLLGVLYSKYDFPSSLINPFSVAKLELNEKQVQSLVKIDWDMKKVIIKSIKSDLAAGRAVRHVFENESVLGEMSRLITLAKAVLTPHQFRAALTCSHQMNPGERWSVWLARQEPDERQVLERYYPDLVAQAAKEGESGIIQTP